MKPGKEETAPEFGSDISQFWIYDEGEKIVIADYGSGTVDLEKTSIVGEEIAAFAKWLLEVSK